MRIQRITCKQCGELHGPMALLDIENVSYCPTCKAKLAVNDRFDSATAQCDLIDVNAVIKNERRLKRELADLRARPECPDCQTRMAKVDMITGLGRPLSVWLCGCEPPELEDVLLQHTGRKQDE